MWWKTTIHSSITNSQFQEWPCFHSWLHYTFQRVSSFLRLGEMQSILQQVHNSQSVQRWKNENMDGFQKIWHLWIVCHIQHIENQGCLNASYVWMCGGDAKNSCSCCQCEDLAIFPPQNHKLGNTLPRSQVAGSANNKHRIIILSSLLCTHNTCMYLVLSNKVLREGSQINFHHSYNTSG